MNPKTPSQSYPTDARNREIARAILNGASPKQAGVQAGISGARAHQIVHAWCKRAHPNLYAERPPGVLQMPWLREHKHLFGEIVRDIPLGGLGLTVRVLNGLRRERITTLGELANCSRKQLGFFTNIGKGCMTEIEAVLARYRLALLPDPPAERVRRFHLR